jgi:RNA polymerase sigma-70 factor (ECF subfamily)
LTWHALARRRSEASLDAEPELFDIASDDPGPEARYEMIGGAAGLLTCLGDLEPERCRLVLLTYCGGWSREQLAAKLDTPVGTVKTWLHRAMPLYNERP